MTRPHPTANPTGPTPPHPREARNLTTQLLRNLDLHACGLTPEQIHAITDIPLGGDYL